jgi:hypothetical protein
MHWWKLTIRSVLVAALVGFASPAMWYIIAGESQRTPGISKEVLEKMTDAELEAWKQANLRPVSFWEHVKETPRAIRLFWRESLAEGVVVFIVVLIINGAFLTGRKK